VADLQLAAAAIVWGYAVYAAGSELTPQIMADIVSLSSGALVANVASVVILITETVTFRR